MSSEGAESDCGNDTSLRNQEVTGVGNSVRYREVSGEHGLGAVADRLGLPADGLNLHEEGGDRFSGIKDEDVRQNIVLAMLEAGAPAKLILREMERK